MYVSDNHIQSQKFNFEIKFKDSQLIFLLNKRFS